MSEPFQIEVKWAGARSVTVGAGSATTSDAFLFLPNTTSTRGTYKANNAGTPTAGDTVDFYILGSNGDPDGSGADERASADTTHGDYIVTLDTLVTDPAIRNGNTAGYKDGKIRVVNNAASAAVVSCILQEFAS